METNFSILAWRIPQTEEPGGLQSMGLQSWTRLMKVKEESEKVGLKLNFQKTNFMASGPITSRQTDEETMETVADFIFGGSKITADGEW